MFDRLIESGGARPRPPLAAMMLSVLANAALAYGAVTATRAPDAAPAAEAATGMREVVYLIPPPPQRVAFEQIGLRWAGGTGPGLLNAQLDEAALLAVEAGGDGGKGAGRRGREKARAAAADSLLLAGEIEGGTVYVASELDQPAMFDPSSAAPMYPPALQQAGIEGSATLRFVVDSTGIADSSTIEDLAVTHPEFATAVREALPRMHFRPAELGDRRVRQLVEQQFKFKLQFATQSAPADSVPPESFAGGAPADSAPNDSTP